MLNTTYLNEFNSPIRKIVGKVELTKGSTDTNSGENIEYTYNDHLKVIKIDRQGESGKFFGFGIPQKATINLVDKNREINIEKENAFKAFFKVNENDYVNNFPTFYVSEVKRDENTNELTITAQDKLFAAAAHKMSEIETQLFTLLDLVGEITNILGLDLNISKMGSTAPFEDISVDEASIEGTETFREILDDIAEATQSIYYISGDSLVFRRLDSKAAANLKIEKQHYFTLKSEEVKTLGAIASITELGDNVSTTGVSGVTQYVRNNAFWELRKDIDVVLENAIATIGDTSITPFNLTWRGNFLIEPGDKVEITAKDNSTFNSFILSDTITYNGGYSHKTEWKYEEPKTAASNPTTLGEALKETFAKVDKANKRIELVVSEVEANSSAITVLEQDTDSIRSSVSSMKSQVDSTNGVVEELTKKVEATMTDEQVQIAIKNELAKGAEKVETATGFTFDETGLTITKSGKEMKTQITEDGMEVFKDEEAVLTANNKGVNAVNLHATNYLIIDTNSRFENYGDNRTGCFWIGG